MQTEIITPRLTLRRARPGDLDALHALASDWEVVKQTATWPWPPDRAFTATRSTPIPPEDGMGGPVFSGDALVGMIGVAMKEGKTELGYMFAQPYWGRGYATEIGRALIAHAWATYDWPAIEACVFDDNRGSARVLEKLGFTETGPCTGACAARGAVLPTRTFRLPRP
ncbi:MAG: GNAT family N-acetyltransferase [Maritimibacter sp.]|nr:GNAT family N-acetyltransferase [Maritimibacter sp.]